MSVNKLFQTMICGTVERVNGQEYVLLHWLHGNFYLAVKKGNLDGLLNPSPVVLIEVGRQDSRGL